MEEVEEEEAEKWPPIVRGKKYPKIEEAAGPDSNPEELAIKREEAELKLPEEKNERLAQVKAARQNIEKERLQRHREEIEADWSPRQEKENKRIDASDEELEDEFDKKIGALTNEKQRRMERIERGSRALPPGKRPPQTPEYKTPYRDVAQG